MIKVSAIIVTYNTGKIVLDCLESLSQPMSGIEVEIILVDNASSDDTVSLVKTHYPNIRIISNDQNVGFGGGNNIGFKHATGDYIALINPDLKLFNNTLPILVNYLEQNPDTGVVGPRTLNAEGEISLTARPAYTVASITRTYLGLIHFSPEYHYKREYEINNLATTPKDVYWLQGSCLVMPRYVFAKIEGFDEDYFLYVEDADLCQRIRDAGWRIVYVPAAKATHIGGTSTKSQPYIRVRGYHLSPLQFFRKRNKHIQVFAIKLVYTIELLSKYIIRRTKYIFKRDSLQLEQAKAELKVLVESWRF